MGCLFSILKKKEPPTLTQRLASDLSGSEDSEIDQKDLEDFSQIKTRQIFVTDSVGENTKKVSVDDFTMLKVILDKFCEFDIDFRFWVRDLLGKSSLLRKKTRVHDRIRIILIC